MKLEAFDDGEKFSEKYFTSASILISVDDTIVYKRFKEDIILPSIRDFNFILNKLNEGDSAHFKVPKEVLNKELTTISLGEMNVDFVDIIIKIEQFFTPEEYTVQYGSYDDEMIEQLLLSKLLKENNSVDYKFKNGMYIKKLKEGKGKKIKKGDVISVKYKGSFINRLIFDNNYKKSSFTFKYGTPDQVIKGLNIAINGMKNGEKSKIIIPSHLAFGEEGSSTQIVPPFTTVIYELEIVNVKQAVSEIVIENLN
jgi:hypothetical protein